MPIYEYACGCGYRFERLARIADADAPAPACPACGTADCRRVPSVAALLGRAAVPPGRDAAPRSWEQTNHGDRDTIRHWQRNLEQRGKLEEKYPELAGDNRAVLAHEGRYAARPLRAGDPATPGPPGSPPADPHGHHHPHGHAHPHTHNPAPTAPSEPPRRSPPSAPT
ncbi:MAG TPA: zinc ribbon domain-containing protein [Trebonia sp.]